MFLIRSPSSVLSLQGCDCQIQSDDCLEIFLELHELWSGLSRSGDAGGVVGGAGMVAYNWWDSDSAVVAEEIEWA